MGKIDLNKEASYLLKAFYGCKEMDENRRNYLKYDLLFREGGFYKSSV